MFYPSRGCGRWEYCLLLSRGDGAVTVVGVEGLVLLGGGNGVDTWFVGLGFLGGRKS